MSIASKSKRLTPDEYLQSESARSIKHELIDGQIVAMAGASANHERICQNLSRKLGNHLEGQPCEPFGSDMKVRVRDNFYYPDILVDCHFDESEPYYTETPVLIVEVISRSTRRMDEKHKLVEYLNVPSLQEYMTVEQDVADVTLYRKSDDWRSVHYFLGETIHLESIDLALDVKDIYQRVRNDDVVAFYEDSK
tara:strand:- start:536 stop:1117 length:582 start_codon:yes stop_codon:yes gene_type:complete